MWVAVERWLWSMRLEIAMRGREAKGEIVQLAGLVRPHGGGCCVSLAASRRSGAEIPLVHSLTALVAGP